MSTKKYDYLIVGSGLFGSVFAREMTDAGAKCLVIEKRPHIGGNCYTRREGQIDVHQYGPHIFHTNNEKIWKYVNRWTEFDSFMYRPKVNFKNNIYSFPINMMTLHQIWGVNTPSQAVEKLNQSRVKIEKPSNLEEWILSQVGEEIYKTFIYGYTKKQWGRDPKELPSFIIKRLPIRLTYEDNYFNDRYQGMPKNGYTEIFKNLLKGIDIETGADYLVDQEYFDSMAKKTVYTGAIDEFFDYQYGELEWRSLRFEEEFIENGDFQGTAVINYTEFQKPYTRIIEHKHFSRKEISDTFITREYPQEWNRKREKFYPINDKKNNNLFMRYKKQIDSSKYILGGRLADYKYYDMHQVIASSLKQVSKELQQ